MDEEARINRRVLIGIAGGAVLATESLGRLSDALAAGEAQDVIEPGILTDIRGSIATTVSDGGRVLAGAIKSKRPLHLGDRVVFAEETDGSKTVSPLYVGVEGVVSSGDRKQLVISGARYAIDDASAARRRENSGWLEVGPVADHVRPGTQIQALCIVNTRTRVQTVAMAWV